MTRQPKHSPTVRVTPCGTAVLNVVFVFADRLYPDLVLNQFHMDQLTPKILSKHVFRLIGKFNVDPGKCVCVCVCACACARACARACVRVCACVLI